MSIQTIRKGTDSQVAGPTNPCGRWKFRRDITGVKSPNPTRGPPAQDSSARKVSPHNFWLQKPRGFDSVEETSGAPSSSSWRSHARPHLLRFTPSELQHLGSSLKGTSVIQRETEVFSIMASRGHCPFAKPSTNRATEAASWCHIWYSIHLANTVSPALEIPIDSAPPNLQVRPSSFSIWMAGLGSCGPTASILSNKQHLASVSPRLSNSSSQLRFSVWLHLGISKPTTSSTHLRLLFSSSTVPQAKHRWGLTLVCTTQETPEPAHPVDSYRPHQSTTTLPLHSWPSMEGRYWCSVVTARPCSWLARINPSHWSANSNQDSTTRGGCTQSTPRAYLECPYWVIWEAMPLGPTGHLLH